MKKEILISVFIGIGILIFLNLERPADEPISEKLNGNETLETVSEKLEHLVFNRLKANFDHAGFDDFPRELILVGLKEERLLQVYAKTDQGTTFIKQYPFTAFSGTLGPKLKEGDKQIPEGIYKIEYLNPNSSYHLSLKINFPNKFDQLKSEYSRPSEMGSDIFIHGKSVTVGCIPVGDAGIEELFILASKAIDREIKVILSPRDFRNNPAYPNVDSVGWAGELYDLIRGELEGLPRLEGEKWKSLK